MSVNLSPARSQSDRVRLYLAKIPGAVSGSGGHDATFIVACKLVNGFALSAAEALPLLLEWNNSCQPPWDDAALRHKLADAERAPHTKPHGHLLASGERTAQFQPPRSTPPAAPLSRPWPNRSGFGPGAAQKLVQLAKSRP